MILRPILAFFVVCCHFWKIEEIDGLYKVLDFGRGIAVPCFFVISFALNAHKMDEQHVFRRLKRLYIPLLFWGCIYTIYTIGRRYLLHRMVVVSWQDIVLQLLFGVGYDINSTLWFIGHLIIVNIIFLLCRKISFLVFTDKGEEAFSAMVAALAMTCLLAQYSGLESVSIRNLSLSLKQLVGRMFESIPLAVCGYYLGRNGEIVKKRRLDDLLLCVGLIILNIIAEPYYIPGDFGYGGVGKSITAIAIVILFAGIPIKNMPSSVHKLLCCISGYSFGIYCMHILVGSMMITICKRLIGKEQYTLFSCVIIYLISFVICYLIDYFSKGKLKRIVS